MNNYNFKFECAHDWIQTGNKTCSSDCCEIWFIAAEEFKLFQIQWRLRLQQRLTTFRIYFNYFSNAALANGVYENWIWWFGNILATLVVNHKSTHLVASWMRWRKTEKKGDKFRMEHFYWNNWHFVNVINKHGDVFEITFVLCCYDDKQHQLFSNSLNSMDL